MFNIDLQTLLGATPRDVIALMAEIVSLMEQLIFNHNWMSNTQLAAIAEAQGLEFVRSNGRTADHAAALRQALRALENSDSRVRDSLQRIRNPEVGNALREVLRPLFDMSRRIRSTGQATLNCLPDVARLNPRRLEGVGVATGERGRASSVVQRLAQQAVQLRARGVDPTLVRTTTPQIRAAVAEAEALAADEGEAVVKMTPVVAAMRLFIANQLRAATAVTRAALDRFLGPLETLLAFLARTLGGRLSTFILIPRSVLDEMLRGAGIARTDAS